MSLPYDQNQYRCTILRHVDADTTWVSVDLGFDCSVRLSIRWDGIDAPERSTDAGKAATAFVNSILAPGVSCLLTTCKDKKEKFGRYLGTFWFLGNGEQSVNQLLIETGHAVAYDGGPRG